MNDLDTTVWRGMQIGHPVAWELAVASGPDDPGKCVFADRHYQRLSVAWERLTFMPNIDLLMKKFHHRQRPDVTTTELGDLPSEWFGVHQETPTGEMTNALRIFPEQRCLVEIALVWPHRRDRDLEADILTSITPLDPDRSATRWAAHGLDLDLASEFELVKSVPNVGRIHWEFDDDSRVKARGPIVIEKLAMAGNWLKDSLANWIPTQLPASYRVRSQRAMEMNGHAAQEVISEGKIDMFAAWRGLSLIRIDVAWICPVEQRLFHVHVTQKVEGHSLSLPDSLHIRCCQPRFLTRETVEDLRPTRKERPTDRARSPQDFLHSVPWINSSMELRPKPDGTAVAEVPFHKPKYLIPPLSWVLPFGKYRRIGLDAMGLSLINLCDGRRTVEKIIEIFAVNNKLTFREAQLTVTQYLRQLTLRGVTVLVGKDND